MRLTKLQKVKLGENYPVIRATFKTIWGRTIKRDLFLSPVGWKYADTDQYCFYQVVTTFHDSGEFEYIVNG